MQDHKVLLYNKRSMNRDAHIHRLLAYQGHKIWLLILLSEENTGNQTENLTTSTHMPKTYR